MKTKNAVRRVVFISLAACITAVCSWLTVPFAVPFTMQTFALFLVLTLLGGKDGTIAVAVYLVMGAVGLPVFSGFRGGIGHLLGPTGGYLVGFLLTGLCVWLFERFEGKRIGMLWVSLSAGLLLCYAAGTVWFCTVMGTENMWSALLLCVIPYVLPDAVKLIVAVWIGRTVKKKVGEGKFEA